MFSIGSIGFTSPFLLLGLLALPILWVLLRAVPPAPIKRRFPGVALLLGLTDEETQFDKTPWWLMLLRMLAVAAMIIGFAGPVLNPQVRVTGTGPLLILADGTWADAPDWNKRQDKITALLNQASRAGRVVSVAVLTDLPAQGASFQSADAWLTRVAGLGPSPFAPDADALSAWAESIGENSFETYWMSDGLAYEGRKELLKTLQAKGAVTVLQTSRLVKGLRPVELTDGKINLTAVRNGVTGEDPVTITAVGLDPSGVERNLASVDTTFMTGEPLAQVSLTLPPELRNRISRFVIDGLRSAGAVTLADDGFRRRKVAMIAGSNDREGLQLLSPLHYLNKALEPSADLLRGGLDDVLPANPDVIILADVATLTEQQSVDVIDWVERGGLLVRFAGIRTAASDIGRGKEDVLLPVRLRRGGRTVGGAMSWGTPKNLALFSQESPFFGLQIPDDVVVSAQVLAQPDPTLANRVIAQLADGTPLVTRKSIGQGQVVLFHVTANTQWSTLPLSGLFVQMLERLAILSRPTKLETEELQGTVWTPISVLDAFGQMADASAMVGVSGENLANATLNIAMPPGVYQNNDRVIAVNVIGPETILQTATWPNSVTVEGLSPPLEKGLKGMFLAAAMGILMLDILASLFVAGRLIGPRSTALVFILAIGMLGQPDRTYAQDSKAIAATSELVLAYVITRDAKIDRASEAGLTGLSNVLFRRSTIEPADPVGIDLERDELAFYPFIYWPISAKQPTPSENAYAKLNRYLRGGGMILFDTRDGDIAGFGGNTPEGKKLKQLARALDIPPLEPLPEDHVLTRSFYLLQDFPGRFTGRDVWVEAAPASAEKVEGMPFRNLNDGVTPVVIGGNDWAAAWATDKRGNYLFRVGRGYAGERQREIAYRFGVNLIMYVLTGNYKSDQVHVPALLERLGQ